MKQFSPQTIQHLGHYVYALIDPKDDKIFYVGKGQGNRVFDHANAALAANEVTANDKLDTIRQIIARGQEVKHLILRHGLKEDEAFIVESVLIDLLTNPLTLKKKIDANMKNLQKGHDMRELGIRSVEDIEAQYGSTPLGYVTDKVIIININKSYCLPDTSIYDATRASWVLSKRRADQARYILSEYKGVIRAVFEFDDPSIGWQPCPKAANKRQRYYFDGHEVSDQTVLNRYINKRVNKKRGGSNPIRYMGIK